MSADADGKLMKSASRFSLAHPSTRRSCIASPFASAARIIPGSGPVMPIKIEINSKKRCNLTVSNDIIIKKT